MKCYYHEDRDAVATCQNCGKGLCKECASKHIPCYCPDCWNRMQEQRKIEREASRTLAQEQMEHRKLTEINYYKKKNNEILICMLIGGLLFISYILMRKYIFGGFSEIDSQSTMTGKIMICILINGIVGSIFFVLPFGWNVLRKHLDKDSIVMFWLTIIIRILLSILVGYVAFPCYVGKLIINTIKIKKMNRELAL